jgi:hypothetical protein
MAWHGCYGRNDKVKLMLNNFLVEPRSGSGSGGEIWILMANHCRAATELKMFNNNEDGISNLNIKNCHPFIILTPTPAARLAHSWFASQMAVSDKNPPPLFTWLTARRQIATAIHPFSVLLSLQH